MQLRERRVLQGLFLTVGGCVELLSALNVLPGWTRALAVAAVLFAFGLEIVARSQ